MSIIVACFFGIIMCTAFVKRGKDLIYGYNLDIDPSTWNYALYKTKNYFSVGIKVGTTVYLTAGVNNVGNFGNIPYMNGADFVPPKGVKRQRIDLMVDKYIRNKYDFGDVERIVESKTLVSIPQVSFHSLIANSSGDILLVEPGYGNKRICDNYAVVTNFPCLAVLDDYSNPFYGKGRFDVAEHILAESDDEFSVFDGLDLLKKTAQQGTWATRVSFVYSRNINKAYYCLDGNFDDIKTFSFGN